MGVSSITTRFTEPMHSNRYANIKKGLAAIGILALIWFPDVVWELFFELIHTVLEWVMEALHLIFEAVETALDFLIEHLFETGLRATQLIVFYIIVALMFILVYGLFRWFQAEYRNWFQAWLRRLHAMKMGAHQLFQRMGMAEKVKWLALVVFAFITRILLGF